MDQDDPLGSYQDKFHYPTMRDEKNLIKGIWSHLDKNGNKLRWCPTSERDRKSVV